MAFFDEMTDHLKQRIDNSVEAAKPYEQFVFLSDIHYVPNKDPNKENNPGFEAILQQIYKERDKTLFVLLGGDMINYGYQDYYNAFMKRCRQFYNDTMDGPGGTGVPIIPSMGNHEYYTDLTIDKSLPRYNEKIGKSNYSIEIPEAALKASLTLITFRDSMPRIDHKIAIPNFKNNCVNQNKDYHLFQFPHSYIEYNPKDPGKYSKFPTFLKEAQGKHIIVTMHVPPRKNPLANLLDTVINEEYGPCATGKALGKIRAYYRDLWTLVHEKSTADSTQWFIDCIKDDTRVELVLAGHVHTYYPFLLPKPAETNHTLEIVIDGCGGNKSAMTFDPNYPVSDNNNNYNYIMVKYDAVQKRFKHEIAYVND
jgi:hypothetical protein